MKTCRVPGCTEPTRGRWSVLCGAHEKAQRRHGDARQQGVTKAQLAPYEGRVRARIEKNGDRVNWSAIEARWLAVVDHAEDVLRRFASGQPGASYEMDAAKAVTRLAAAVDPREVVVVVAAMYLMLAEDPRRFVSDEGFRYQLVRRVRGLSHIEAGTYHDHTTGKAKRVYRDLRPRATAVMGMWVAEALGVIGVHFQRLEERDRQREADARDALRDALAQID